MPIEVLPEMTIVWPIGWESKYPNMVNLMKKETRQKRLLIFVSAPFTIGDTSQNIRRACFAGDEILRKGHIPFIPHLFHFWDLISPKSWEKWMEIDLAILERCDALLRLYGQSEGADIEITRAKELGLTIYYYWGEIPHI